MPGAPGSDVFPALSSRMLQAAKQGTEYRVTETGPFLERVAHLHAADRTRLRSRLEATVFPQLRLDPRAGHARKTRDDEDGEVWGFYLGNWTIFYKIVNATREVQITGVTQKESTIVRHRS